MSSPVITRRQREKLRRGDKVWAFAGLRRQQGHVALGEVILAEENRVLLRFPDNHRGARESWFEEWHHRKASTLLHLAEKQRNFRPKPWAVECYNCHTRACEMRYSITAVCCEVPFDVDGPIMWMDPPASPDIHAAR